jgi:hypothetical protein
MTAKQACWYVVQQLGSCQLLLASNNGGTVLPASIFASAYQPMKTSYTNMQLCPDWLMRLLQVSVVTSGHCVSPDDVQCY